MKTRNDFRLQFNKEKQLHVLVTDGTGYIHYSDDYVHWLEELAMKQANGDSTGEGQSNIPGVIKSVCPRCGGELINTEQYGLFCPDIACRIKGQTVL